MDCVEEHPIRRVAILGAGTMGCGLASLLPQFAYDVVLRTRRDCGRVQEAVEATLARLVRTGVLSADRETAVRERLVVTNSLAEAAQSDLVVEALQEEKPLKRQALGTVASLSGRETLLASTTSSIRISTLAEGIAFPERFLGLHFFNPVPKMRLVEVAVTEHTDGAFLHRATAFVESIGKVPVVVRDTPGFIVNQLALACCNRGIRLLEEGVASVDDIDRAMRIGAGHPLGPLELGDTIGWDVVLAALDNMARATGDDAYLPRPLLRQLVASQRLGRKSGRGIYLYDGPGGTRVRSAPDIGLLAPHGG